MDTTEAQELCICPDCPTYSDCGESLAFCLYPQGKSSCIAAQNGCICPGCPVYAADRMTSMYFCMRGSETAQTSA